MSIINEALAPCSKCGQQHKITVYRSINIADNPELKAKVRDGSLFLWECPHCGQVNLAKYETLYHDPSAKVMFWLIPAGEISESQMQAITMHTKAMGGYTLRRVNDMGTLMEKVLIADAGLDDVVLEMCKYVISTAAKVKATSVCLPSCMPSTVRCSESTSAGMSTRTAPAFSSVTHRSALPTVSKRSTPIGSVRSWYSHKSVRILAP